MISDKWRLGVDWDNTGFISWGSRNAPPNLILDSPTYNDVRVGRTTGVTPLGFSYSYTKAEVFENNPTSVKGAKTFEIPRSFDTNTYWAFSPVTSTGYGWSVPQSSNLYVHLWYRVPIGATTGSINVDITVRGQNNQPVSSLAHTAGTELASVNRTFNTNTIEGSSYKKVSLPINTSAWANPYIWIQLERQSSSGSPNGNVVFGYLMVTEGQASGWNNGGTYYQYDDISEWALRVNTNLGTSDIKSRVADKATLKADLYNEDNVFSIHRTDSPLYNSKTSGARVLLQYYSDHLGYYTTAWSGYLSKLTPIVGNPIDKISSIEAELDPYRLKNTTFRYTPYTFEEPASELFVGTINIDDVLNDIIRKNHWPIPTQVGNVVTDVTKVGAEAIVSSVNEVFTSGSMRFYGRGWENISYADAIRGIIESVGAWFFIREDGTIVSQGSELGSTSTAQRINLYNPPVGHTGGDFDGRYVPAIDLTYSFGSDVRNVIEYEYIPYYYGEVDLLPERKDEEDEEADEEVKADVYWGRKKNIPRNGSRRIRKPLKNIAIWDYPDNLDAVNQVGGVYEYLQTYERGAVPDWADIIEWDPEDMRLYEVYPAGNSTNLGGLPDARDKSVVYEAPVSTDPQVDSDVDMNDWKLIGEGKVFNIRFHNYDNPNTYFVNPVAIRGRVLYLREPELYKDQDEASIVKYGGEFPFKINNAVTQTTVSSIADYYLTHYKDAFTNVDQFTFVLDSNNPDTDYMISSLLTPLTRVKINHPDIGINDENHVILGHSLSLSGANYTVTVYLTTTERFL